MVWFSPLRGIFSLSCLLRRCLQPTMMYGKKIGRLVKKYIQTVELRSKRRRWSGRLCVSSCSSSHGFNQSSGSDGNNYWDMDEEAAGVPIGCLAVYVGPEMRRFVIQASFLYIEVVRELLRRSEEEYGFDSACGLRIPCEARVFEELLWELETGRTS